LDSGQLTLGSGGGEFEAIHHHQAAQSEKGRHDCCVLLAAGVAAEEIIYGEDDFDRVGCSADADRISNLGGGSIEAYVPEAREILIANRAKFDLLSKTLLAKYVGTYFSGQPSDFVLMSAKEIIDLWNGK